MSDARRLMALVASVAALSTGAVILTTHAADHVPPSKAAQSVVAQPARGTAPVDALTGATAPKPSAAGAPQVPEESATIRDDPTVAPDPKQSADNSVSFPNDI